MNQSWTNQVFGELQTKRITTNLNDKNHAYKRQLWQGNYLLNWSGNTVMNFYDLLDTTSATRIKTINGICDR